MSIESQELTRFRALGFERVAGAIIAEFVDPSDARAFADAKGPGYTVTGGINHPYAVRVVRYVRQMEDCQ